MNNILKNSIAGICMIILAGCNNNPMKGTWQYDGGVYNGKSQNASTEFKMQRSYDASTYEAYVLEGENEPELYNSGVYETRADSIYITSKFSSQPSQNTDVTIAYKFRIEGDKMTTNGVLPNGMVVEEYWKKVK